MNASFLHVEEAKYLDHYRIHLRFSDSSSGIVDLRDHLVGEVFEPLKSEDIFKQFALESGTLGWQNGADFAPEFLRELLLVLA